MEFPSQKLDPAKTKPALHRGNGTGERERELLFERETEHLWLRQLMHGIGGEGPPRWPASETVTPLTS